MFINLLLHLHKIVEELCFHCSLSVRVCVCLSVSEQHSRPNRRTDWNAVFAYPTGSDPCEIGDLGLEVKVTVTKYPFFLYNSLLFSLL